jgi:hypothetical protein
MGFFVMEPRYRLPLREIRTLHGLYALVYKSSDWHSISIHSLFITRMHPLQDKMRGQERINLDILSTQDELG